MKNIIEREHISELIRFLRNDANSKNFNQERGHMCCGAHLAKITGRGSGVEDILSEFVKFKTEENPFGWKFKDGDPLEIADWFEKEILDKCFLTPIGKSDEWVTLIHNNPVTILHIDTYGTMVGFYRNETTDYKVNGIWNEYGETLTDFALSIERKKKPFTPILNMPYLVTEEFKVQTVTYPVNAVLTWKSKDTVTASVSKYAQGEIAVNEDWSFTPNKAEYPLKLIE